MYNKLEKKSFSRKIITYSCTLFLITLFYLNVHVAPHVGAWIETRKGFAVFLTFTSRPTWARGLKLLYHALLIIGCCRAPRGRVD